MRSYIGKGKYNISENRQWSFYHTVDSPFQHHPTYNPLQSRRHKTRCQPVGRAKISSHRHERSAREWEVPTPRSPHPHNSRTINPLFLLSHQFPLHHNMAINRLLCFLFFCHGALGINFPGLRVPLSRPRTSIYSLESCTDTSSSGKKSL